MKLSRLIIDLIKFRLTGIKYVDFWLGVHSPPSDGYGFLISGKTITLKNFL